MAIKAPITNAHLLPRHNPTDTTRPMAKDKRGIQNGPVVPVNKNAISATSKATPETKIVNKINIIADPKRDNLECLP